MFNLIIGIVGLLIALIGYKLENKINWVVIINLPLGLLNTFVGLVLLKLI
jgi:hypothetical protein